MCSLKLLFRSLVHRPEMWSIELSFWVSEIFVGGSTRWVAGHSARKSVDTGLMSGVAYIPLHLVWLKSYYLDTQRDRKGERPIDESIHFSPHCRIHKTRSDVVTRSSVILHFDKCRWTCRVTATTYVKSRQSGLLTSVCSWYQHCICNTFVVLLPVMPILVQKSNRSNIWNTFLQPIDNANTFQLQVSKRSYF